MNFIFSWSQGGWSVFCLFLSHFTPFEVNEYVQYKDRDPSQTQFKGKTSCRAAVFENGVRTAEFKCLLGVKTSSAPLLDWKLCFKSVWFSIFPATNILKPFACWLDETLFIFHGRSHQHRIRRFTCVKRSTSHRLTYIELAWASNRLIDWQLALLRLQNVWNKSVYVDCCTKCCLYEVGLLY